MHAATLKSNRLQRILKVLSDGRPHSTRDIVRRAGVMAVSVCMAELRQNGAEIDCQRETDPIRGAQRWNYTLIKAPKA